MQISAQILQNSKVQLDSYSFDYPPVIIGGCGRSGTTLLLSILSAHPNIYAIPQETEIFARMEGRIKDFLPLIQKHRYCEKTPKNVQQFKEILKLFKGTVRLVHVVRDGRDVVTSKHPQNPDKYWVSIERWVEDVSAGILPYVYTIKYEDIICDFKSTIKKLLRFIGEDYTDEIDLWHDYATVRTHSAWSGNVKNLFTESIGRWKSKEYEARIQEFMQNKRAVKLLEELGYIG